jgi:hypothetical protein
VIFMLVMALPISAPLVCLQGGQRGDSAIASIQGMEEGVSDPQPRLSVPDNAGFMVSQSARRCSEGSGWALSSNPTRPFASLSRFPFPGSL